MKATRIIELLQSMVSKNQDIDVQIIIPEEELDRIRELRDKTGNILYDVSINEEEHEDFVESGLALIFPGEATSDIPLKTDVVGPTRIEITLGHPREPGQIPSWERMRMIPLNVNTRSFFPGFKVPFTVESDIGLIHTHITSAVGGKEVTGGNKGRYISRGMSKWYKKHSELNPGDTIIFDALEPGKRYKMSIRYKNPVVGEEKTENLTQYLIDLSIDDKFAIYETMSNEFGMENIKISKLNADKDNFIAELINKNKPNVRHITDLNSFLTYVLEKYPNKKVEDFYS